MKFKVIRDTNPKNPEGKKRRAVSKGICLAAMYGMGPQLLKDILKCDVEEAKEKMKLFYKLFPAIDNFVKKNLEFSLKNHYIEDYMGRRRYFPDLALPDYTVYANKPEYYDIPMLDCRSGLYSISNKQKSDDILNDLVNTSKMKGDGFELAKFKEAAYKKEGNYILNNKAFKSKAYTQTTNAIIQGGAATITKAGMLEIDRDPEIKKLGGKVLIPVHDEIVCEGDFEHAEKLGELVAEAMIRSSRNLGISVDMACDCYVVHHWFIDEIAGKIRQHYLDLLNSGKPKEDALGVIFCTYNELTEMTLKEMAFGVYDPLRGGL